ncbi:hypothetical protein HDU76_013366 [Blyttiomyces sp. JEL0837]|nr:hypothetical protein HDU76_013366 [Blyttiomyces sp. JEL0837]
MENIVLADLISIIQPSAIPSTYTRTYFRNVFTDSQKTLTAADCAGDLAAALPVATVTCGASATVTPTPTGKSGASKVGVSGFVGLVAAVLGAFAL